MALPALAEAVRTDEAEQKSRQFVAELQRLAARTGGEFKMETK